MAPRGRRFELGSVFDGAHLFAATTLPDGAAAIYGYVDRDPDPNMEEIEAAAWRSMDAKTWTRFELVLPARPDAETPSYRTIGAIASGAGGYLTVDGYATEEGLVDLVLYSSDGARWEVAAHFGPDGSGWTDGLRDYAAGDEGFVLVGERYEIDAEQRVYLPIVRASADGRTWIDADPEAMPEGPNLLVAAVEGDWIATQTDFEAGTDVTWFSHDGVTWEERASLDVPDPPGSEEFGEGNVSVIGTIIEAGDRAIISGAHVYCCHSPWYAAGIWSSFETRSSPRCASSRTTRRCWSSPASRSASSAPTQDAPRVLIANSNLVPHWATWEQFRGSSALGLTMYGQMTAGSWIYIGTQGILQGTYETFAELARQHFGGTLAGRLVRHRRARRHGRRPAAGRDHERRRRRSVVEIDAPRASTTRSTTGYVDEVTDDLDEALALVEDGAPRAQGAARSASSATPPRCFPSSLAAAARPTSSPTRPPPTTRSTATSRGLALTRRPRCARAIPSDYVAPRKAAMAAHVARCSSSKRARRGDLRLRQQHPRQRRRTPASTTPSTTPASSRPTSGRSSARATARSAGSRSPAIPTDIAATDRRCARALPERRGLQRWLRLAARACLSRACPARICWLGYGDRAKAGLRFNDLVATGEVKAPIVIGRDHLDAGSVASPNRETEAMHDGSDAIADWPILNALVNTAAGATWVSFHHGGGVGIGYSLHAGMVVVADGTPEAAARLERVLDQRSGHGRPAPRRRRLRARDRSRPRERGVRIPMRDGTD